jgi:DNA repair protein RecO (recombination protein O)
MIQYGDVPTIMIQSTTGIILRTLPFMETSLIVRWLTPDAGRIATVAKGARRPKSPFLGKLDLFYAADFSFSRSRRSELHTLREVSLRDTHAALRQNLGFLRQAAYGAALVEQTTEADTPLAEIHALFSEFLDCLERQPFLPRTVLAFELKLLRVLGLKPDLTASRLAPDARALVTALAETEWEALGKLDATAGQARAVNQFLHGFLIYHLGRLPKGRNAALGR